MAEMSKMNIHMITEVEFIETGRMNSVGHVVEMVG